MSKKNKSAKKMTNKKPANKAPFRFPSSLLKPVSLFLVNKLKMLKKRKKEIDTEDPFKDTSRVMDNASPDTEAAEQFGHARTSALKSEIDRKIVQIRQALTRIRVGKYGLCEDCGKMIDTDRLVIYPEATLCIECGKKREK